MIAGESKHNLDLQYSVVHLVLFESFYGSFLLKCIQFCLMLKHIKTH